MSGTVLEEIITFGQTMKDFSGRHYTPKKKKKKSKSTAPNDIRFEKCTNMH